MVWGWGWWRKWRGMDMGGGWQGMAVAVTAKVALSCPLSGRLYGGLAGAFSGP